MATIKVVFIENEDSFSWNVVECLPFARHEIAILSGRTAGPMLRRLTPPGALVIGPGPMDPERAGLLDIVHFAAQLRIPTLGICLGHQALGLAFGARLVRIHPMHGKRSPVTFGSSRLFPGIDGTRTVMRYHSLALSAVSTPLKVVAVSQDSIPMAIEHDTLPMAGLQFHPDSYASERGAEIVEAFFRAIS